MQIGMQRVRRSLRMDQKEISGKLIRPDGTEQYWWNGVNYLNVIPEELIDAVLALEHENAGKGKRGKYNE